MKGDFSRLTFDPRRHYRSVRMQQGRLQVDADWNEHVDLLMHRLETEVADFVGDSGVPAPTGGGGFAVTVQEDDSGATPRWRLHVASGRCYVGGRLVENDQDVVLDADGLVGAAVSGRQRFVAYLDTWSRHVTFVEDPGLRDVALGGPDTATREQSAWRCALDPVAADVDPAVLRAGWAPAAAARRPGSMTARLAGDGARVDNQLYRVEVYDSTGDQVRFTWSRDNGSVVARIEAVYGASRTLVVDSAGRDAATSIGTRSWIELVTRATARRRRAGRGRAGRRGGGTRGGGHGGHVAMGGRPGSGAGAGPALGRPPRPGVGGRGGGVRRRVGLGVARGRPRGALRTGTERRHRLHAGRLLARPGPQRRRGHRLAHRRRRAAGGAARRCAALVRRAGPARARRPTAGGRWSEAAISATASARWTRGS